MNVLLSGYSGYLGSNISKYLLQEEHNLILLDQNYSINYPVPFYDTFFYLSNPNELHFGRNAKNAVNDAVNHFYKILSVLDTIKVSHVVYASTLRIYDDKKNMYANTHLFIENLIETYCAQNGILLTKARFGNIFGGTFSSMVKRDTLVPHIFIKEAMTTHKITLNTDGKQYRDFTPMSIVLKYIDYILSKRPEMIDICTGHSLQIITVVKIIKESFPNISISMGNESTHEIPKIYNSIIEIDKKDIEIELINVTNMWKKHYGSDIK